MQIYKQSLEVYEEINVVYLPYKTAEEARKAILHMDNQFGTPCFWYEHNKKMAKEEYGEFTIMRVECHEDVSDIFNEEEYIGSIYFDDGKPYVEQHYYLVDSKEMTARLEKRAEKLKAEIEEQKQEAANSEAEILMFNLSYLPGIDVIELPYASLDEARENIKCVDLCAGIPTIWYEVKKDSKKALKQFLIITICTGFDTEDRLSREEYIGTALFSVDSVERHYFLVDKAKYQKKYNIEWLDKTERKQQKQE